MMRLPPELIDRIIDHLHNDEATLKSFCLVSRAFVASSRFHLWKKLRLTPYSVYEGILTREPFASPRSSVYELVKELEIEDGRGRYAPMWLDDNIYQLVHFTSIHTLRLRVVNFGIIYPPNIRLFNSTFARTVRLVLTQVYFESVQQLDDLIHSLSGLQSIGFFSAVEWKRFALPDTTTPKFPSSLHTLETDVFKKQSLLARFLGPDNFRSITVLHLTRLWPDDVQYVSGILPAFGGVLEVLTLGLLPLSSSIWRRVHPPIIISEMFDLSHNTGLRRLMLCELSVYDPSDLPLGHDWASKLLLQLKSLSLEEVALEILADTPDAVRLLDLPRAVSYFSRARFPKIRQIILDATGDAPEGMIRGAFGGYENSELLIVRCAVPDPVFLTFA